MALETIVRTLRDTKITFNDNGILTFDITLERGTLTYTVGPPTVEEFLDRGQHTVPPSLRYGDDGIVSGSVSGYLADMTDPAVETLNDLLHQSGYLGANWVSTLGANSEVFTVEMVVTIEGTAHGVPAGVDAIATFAYCEIRGGLTEGLPTELSLDFQDFENFPTIADI